MKTLLVAAVGAALVLGSGLASADSSSPFGYQIAYDFKAKTTLALGSFSVSALPDVVGLKGVCLKSYAFGGSGVGARGVTGGFAVGIEKSFGGLTGVVGVGQAFFAGDVPHGIAFVGVSGRW